MVPSQLKNDDNVSGNGGDSTDVNRNSNNININNDYLSLNDPNLFRLLSDNLRNSLLPINHPLLSSLNGSVPDSQMVETGFTTTGTDSANTSMRLLDDVNVQPSTVLQFNLKKGKANGKANNIYADFGTGNSYRDLTQTPSSSLSLSSSIPLSLFCTDQNTAPTKTSTTQNSNLVVSNPTLGVPFQNEYLLPSPEQLREFLLDSPVGLNLNFLQTRTPSGTPLKFFTEYTGNNKSKLSGSTSGNGDCDSSIMETTTPGSNLIHLFNSVEAQLQQQGEQFTTATGNVNSNNNSNNNSDNNNNNNNNNIRTASNNTNLTSYNRTPLRKLDINLMFGNSSGPGNNQMWLNSQAQSPSKKMSLSLTPSGRKLINELSSPYTKFKDENFNLNMNLNLNLNYANRKNSNSTLVNLNRARKDIMYAIHQRSPLRNSNPEMSFVQPNNNNNTNNNTLIKSAMLTPPRGLEKHLGPALRTPAKQKSKLSPNGIKRYSDGVYQDRLYREVNDTENRNQTGKGNAVNTVTEKENIEAAAAASASVKNDNIDEPKVSAGKTNETAACARAAIDNDEEDGNNKNDMYGSSPTTIQLNSSATKSITEEIELPPSLINGIGRLQSSNLSLGEVAMNNHVKPKEFVLDFSSKRVPLILSPTRRVSGKKRRSNYNVKNKPLNEMKRQGNVGEDCIDGKDSFSVSDSSKATLVPELPKMGSFKLESLSSGNSLQVPNFQPRDQDQDQDSDQQQVHSINTLMSGQIPVAQQQQQQLMNPYQHAPLQTYMGPRSQAMKRTRRGNNHTSTTSNRNSNLSFSSATSTLALSVNQRTKNKDKTKNKSNDSSKRARPKEPKFQVFVSSIHKFNEMNEAVQLSGTRKLHRRVGTGRKRQKVNGDDDDDDNDEGSKVKGR